MTSIEWTDETWNPVTGCSHVSDGCRNCYAEDIAKRFSGTGSFPVFKPWTAPNAAHNVVLHPERLDAPLHWRKPRRVFVNSMSDLFHELVPEEFIDRVFAVMALTPQHTYQVLTKRPERMLAYFNGLYADSYDYVAERIHDAMETFDLWPDISDQGFGTTGEWPLPNVWLGVSAEDQRTADTRIPVLLDTPAAIRFVSAEPLLGPIDLRRIAPGIRGQFSFVDALQNDVPVGHHTFELHPSLGWVIVGAESGPRARPCELDWIEGIVSQCRAAGTPVFVKQDSGPRPGQQGRIPDELWIREWPTEGVKA